MNTSVPLSYSGLTSLSHEELSARLSSSPLEAARIAQAAAKQGVAQAQLVWAQMLLDGVGTSKDPEAAFRWFDVAAQSDEPDAINMLGRCHERGWGCAVDLQKAAELYGRAADMGHGWAMYNLAELLRADGGQKKDRQALALYVKAARRGLGKAMTMVGTARETGWGGARPNLAAARLWYRRGAVRHDFRAHHHLGRLSLKTGDIEVALVHLDVALSCAFPDYRRALSDDLSQHEDPRVRDLAARFAVQDERAAVIEPPRPRLAPRKARRGLKSFLKLK